MNLSGGRAFRSWLMEIYNKNLTWRGRVCILKLGMANSDCSIAISPPRVTVR
jgi:hypothetical protein